MSEFGIEPGQALREAQLRVLRGEDQVRTPAFTEVRPAELPLAARGFAGRAAELAALEDGEDGVWLITGTAGVGKTSLAVRWAHAARDRYPDGQLYVNLRGFDADDEPLSSTAALAQLLRAPGPHRPNRTTKVDSFDRCSRTGKLWWYWTTRATPPRCCRCCRHPAACW